MGNIQEEGEGEMVERVRVSEEEATQATMQTLIDIDAHRAMVRSLNYEQRLFFDHCRKQVIRRQQAQARGGDIAPSLTFLTGGAGTGKSHLLRCVETMLTLELNKTLHADPNQIKVLKAAFTGKAASNVNGCTIHSALRMGFSDSNSGMSDDTKHRLSMKFSQLGWVILDEVSMINQDLFINASRRLNAIRNIPGDSTTVMANLDVILIGCFYQLPTIPENTSLIDTPTRGLGLMHAYWSRFDLYELWRGMRQADAEFFGHLNVIRMGKAPEALSETEEGKAQDDKLKKTIEYFNVRVQKEWPPKDITIPIVFYTNSSCRKHNEHVFQCMDGDTIEIRSNDSVPKDAEIKYLTSEVKHTGKLFKVLRLKPNLFVEVNCDINIDVSDGLVNGQEGLFKAVTKNAGGAHTILWVEFPHPWIGQKARTRHGHLYKKYPYVQKGWTPIMPVTMRFNVKAKSKRNLKGGSAVLNTHVPATRRQFPLHPASGRTLYHVQGSTMQRLGVSFDGKWVKKHGVVYMALSRVTSIEGLFLEKPLLFKDMVCCGHVHAVMAHMRSNKQLHLNVPALSTLPGDTLRLACLNVASLTRKVPDLACDFNLLENHVIFVCEAGKEVCLQSVKPACNPALPPFQAVWGSNNRVRDSRIAPSNNCVMLVDTRVCEVLSCACKVQHRSEILKVLVKHKASDTPHLILGVYKHATCPHEAFFASLLRAARASLLKHPGASLTLLGDWNIDFRHPSPPRDALQALLPRLHADLRLASPQEPTICTESMLDYAFTSSWQHAFSVVGTCYYSDHDPVFLCIPTTPCMESLFPLPHVPAPPLGAIPIGLVAPSKEAPPSSDDKAHQAGEEHAKKANAKKNKKQDNPFASKEQKSPVPPSTKTQDFKKLKEEKKSKEPKTHGTKRSAGNDFPSDFSCKDEFDSWQRMMSSRRPNEVLSFNESISIHITRSKLQCLKDNATFLNDEVVNYYMGLLVLRDASRRDNEGSFPRCHFMNSFFYTKLTKIAPGTRIVDDDFEQIYDFSCVQRHFRLNADGISRQLRNTGQRSASILDVDRIYFPMHRPNHWAMACIDLQFHRLIYWDSMGLQPGQRLINLANWVRDQALLERSVKVRAPFEQAATWRHEVNGPSVPSQHGSFDCGVFACMYADFNSSCLPFTFRQENMMSLRHALNFRILANEVP